MCCLHSPFLLSLPQLVHLDSWGGPAVWQCSAATQELMSTSYGACAYMSPTAVLLQGTLQLTGNCLAANLCPAPAYSPSPASQTKENAFVVSSEHFTG